MKFMLVLHLKSLILQFTDLLLRAGEEVLVGGQAVFEGVMMRAPKAYSVAVRRPDGSVIVKKDRLGAPVEKHWVWGFPVFRGIATLGQAFTLGLKALKFSTDQAMAGGRAEAGESENGTREKKSEMNSWMMIFNVGLALILFIFLFKWLPLLVASRLTAVFPAIRHPVAFSLVDGSVRLLVFLFYIFAISLFKDIRRVFEYHGAEHKVVFTHEARESLSVENARKHSRLHPRCGTSFLLVVMILSMFVYVFIPFNSFAMKLLSRVALIPLVAGLSYEIIRFAAKGRMRLLVWMTTPGLWLQLITTREPEDEQLEIAIRALAETLLMENVEGRVAVT